MKYFIPVITLVILLASVSFYTKAHACSVVMGTGINWPENGAVDVATNTRIIAYDDYYYSYGATVNLTDSDGNVVDGVITDANYVGNDSFEFTPSTTLLPNTTYTITWTSSYDGSIDSVTFITGTDAADEIPQILDLGIGLVRFLVDFPNTCTSIPWSYNEVYLHTAGVDSFSADAGVELFVNYFIAENIASINWDNPTVVTSAEATNLTLRDFNEAKSYVMAVVVADSSGNTSCPYFASFETLGEVGEISIDSAFKQPEKSKQWCGNLTK